MDYNDCEVNDLLSDLSFRKWVLNPASDQSLFWENWLMQNPEKKEIVKQARIILKSLQFSEPELSDEEAYSLLSRIKDTNASREKGKSRQAIVRPLHEDNPDIKHKKRKVHMGYLLRYVAILGGALIFALSANLILESLSGKTGILLVEKVNDKGEKSTIYLPDGTVVNLNSSSRLVYPKIFEKEVRKVYLEGEAFFEVIKSSKPFIVQTDKLETKVLGTSFNVRAFPDNEEYSVALVTGIVVVSPSEGDKDNLVLEPGEKGRVERETAALEKTKFDYEQEIAWKEGVLFIKDLPFKEALHRVEQWYGVEFVVDQMSRQDYQITGRFENESLENVLKSIGFTVRFDYQIKENKVYLNFKN